MKKIEQISDFRTDPHNVNRGTPRGHSIIERSIRQHGAGRSGLAAKDGTMIAGSQTLEEMQALGMKVKPIHTTGDEWVVVVRDDIEPGSEQAVKMGLEDNRATEVGLAFDPLILTELSKEMDLSGLWTEGELSELTGKLVEVGGGDAEPKLDKTAELQQKWGVLPGQLWVCGEHRILCGDSTKREDVERVMGGEKADILINDPPYGMRLDADFSSMKSKPQFTLEKKAYGGHTYADVIGDQADFDATPILSLFADVKEQFWFGADYYCRSLGDTEHEGAWLVWDKRLDEEMDKVYGSCFELIWSRQKHKRDILRHKWAGIFGMEQEDNKSRIHPNQKPIGLYIDILGRYSDSNAILVDCFCGSGTTIIACQNLNRKCRAIEIDPGYVAVSLQRFFEHTNQQPTLL